MAIPVACGLIVFGFPDHLSPVHTVSTLSTPIIRLTHNSPRHSFHSFIFVNRRCQPNRFLPAEAARFYEAPMPDPEADDGLGALEALEALDSLEAGAAATPSAT
eukprot:8800040-Alexandrium_andersonii.AAC.1